MKLVGPSYNLLSRPASVQRTVNMVPVPLEPGNERTPWVLKDVPGLVSAVSSWAPPDSNISLSGTVALATNGFNSTSASFAWPATSQAGDLGVLVVFSQPGRIITPATAGMVQIDDFTGRNGTAGAVCRVFGLVKVAQTSMSVTIDGANGPISGQIFSYRNFLPNDYVDSISGLTNQAGNTTLSYPSASTNYGRTQVLLIAVRAATGWPWHTAGTSGNLENRSESSDSGWTSGGVQSTISVSTARLVNAGSIGAVTSTAGSAAIYSTRVIALR